MSKPLALTQRQVKALCEGAKQAGYAPVLQIGNVLVRLIPEDRAIPPQPEGRIDEPRRPEDFQTIEEYMVWRDRSRAGAD